MKRKILTFLDNHWEKLVLGLSGVFFVFVGYNHFLSSSGDSTGKKLAKKSKELKQTMNDTEDVPPIEIPDRKSKLKGLMNQLPEIGEERLYTFHNPTLVKPGMKQDPDIVTYALSRIEMGEPTVKMGKVSLQWNVIPVKNVDNQAEPEVILQRKQIGDDTWKKLADVTGKYNYTDENFEPRRRYAYRLIIRTDAQEYKKKGNKKRFEGPEERKSNVVEVRTKARFAMKYDATVGDSYIFVIKDRLNNVKKTTSLIKEGDQFSSRDGKLKTNYSLKKITKETYSFFAEKKNTEVKSGGKRVNYCVCTEKQEEIRRLYYEGKDGEVYKYWVEKDLNNIRERYRVLEECPEGKVGERYKCGENQ